MLCEISYLVWSCSVKSQKSIISQCKRRAINAILIWVICKLALYSNALAFGNLGLLCCFGDILSYESVLSSTSESLIAWIEAVFGDVVLRTDALTLCIDLQSGAPSKSIVGMGLFVCRSFSSTRFWVLVLDSKTACGGHLDFQFNVVLFSLFLKYV